MLKSSMVDMEVGLIHRLRLVNKGAIMAVCHSFSGLSYDEVIINEDNEATMFDYRISYAEKERYTRNLCVVGALRKAKILNKFISCDENELAWGDKIVLSNETGDQVTTRRISRLSYYDSFEDGQRPIIVAGQNKVVFYPHKTQDSLAYQMKEAMIKAMPDHRDKVDARYRVIEDYCNANGLDVDELSLEQLILIRSLPEWKNPEVK